MKYDHLRLRIAAASQCDHTAAAAARRLSCPYASVNRWWRGASPPDPAGLLAIQRAYGLTPMDLFEDSPTPAVVMA